MSRRAAAKRQPQKCPPHVRRLSEAYWLERQAYDVRLEAECRGHLGGEEEDDFRALHPAPTFGALLTDYYATWRHDHAAAA